MRNLLVCADDTTRCRQAAGGSAALPRHAGRVSATRAHAAWRWVALLAVTVLTVALEAPAGAGAAPAWRGTTLNAFGYGPATATHDLDLNQQAGANAVRIDIGWADLEPSGKGRYDGAYLAQVDDYLQQTDRRGLKVIAVVQGTPCWASSAPESVRQGCTGDWRARGGTTYPPTDAADYADAAAYIAARWGSKLAAVEVWNEPNNADFWRSSAAASDYARLLKAAYPAVKSRSAELPVLGGALLWSDRDFLEALYANGIHGAFDGLSIHPYDPPNGASYGPKYSFAQGVPWIRDAMVAHGDGDRGLWLTELGWPTCSAGLFWWCVSEGEQAQRLADAFDAAAGWPYIAAQVVYTLRDPGTDPANWQHHMGLRRADDSAKPGWEAFVKALRAPPAPPAGEAPTSPAATPSAQAPSSKPSAPAKASRPGVTITRTLLLRGHRRLRVWLRCAGAARCRALVRVRLRAGRQRNLARKLVTIAAGRQRAVTIRLARRAVRSKLTVVVSPLPHR